jgi:hypothetical protein
MAAAQKVDSKNDAAPQKLVAYSLINIINECRAQGSFGRGQYSSKDCEFEFPPDGSVIVMFRSTAKAAKRRFVRYTAGQWFGEGEVSEA